MRMDEVGWGCYVSWFNKVSHAKLTIYELTQAKVHTSDIPNCFGSMRGIYVKPAIKIK